MGSFEQEFKEFVRIIAGVERGSEENDPSLDDHLDLADALFADANKKYPLMVIKKTKTIDQVFYRILFKEESVKKAFDLVASKIPGLAAIGLHSFEEATTEKQDQFSKLAQSIKDVVFLTYKGAAGSETLVLQWNKKEEMVELNYEVKSLVNSLTPQFQFCSQYAQKEKGQDMDLLEQCYKLGFVDLEDEALFEWEDDFYPKMLE